MSTQYIAEPTNTPDVVEGSIVETNMPVVPSERITAKPPKGDDFPRDVPVDANAESPVALLTPEDSQHFRTTWNEVQGKFVDEPRSAVQQADALVSEVIQQLTQMFADKHTSLESQWKEGSEVSTEDLRQAFLRYHSFFNRLVV